MNIDLSTSNIQRRMATYCIQLRANGWIFGVDGIAKSLKTSFDVIPACLPRYGVEPGAGHAVKHLRYPVISNVSGCLPSQA